MFALFWAFFSRLPSAVVFLSSLLCVILGLRRLFYFAVGRQTAVRCPVWFLGLILVGDVCIVLALLSVVGFLGLLRGLTISTYLASFYAPSESTDPIWLRTIFGELDELSFQFRVDLIAAVFVIVAVVVLSVCLFCYELKNTTTGTVYVVLLKASACCAFCASNLLTFVVFTEISSIIVLLIISQSQSAKRLHAGFLYFMYSSISGILLLVAAAALTRRGESTAFELLGEAASYKNTVTNACVGLIVCALLVKIPTGPFYHWLLKAHVEASTAGSIILAAVMLKIPACALLRIALSFSFRLGGVVVFWLLVCSIFAMVVCTAQMWHESDLKRIVALSSVVHMSGSV
jgi:NADH:ubiquinone oxidoreductase subunit 4 (subunit M)